MLTDPVCCCCCSDAVLQSASCCCLSEALLHWIVLLSSCVAKQVTFAADNLLSGGLLCCKHLYSLHVCLTYAFIVEDVSSSCTMGNLG